MKFRKGDKVRFLDEKGEGVVSRLLGNGMVMVEVQDGFEYPYPASQLVPAEPIQWEKSRVQAPTAEPEAEPQGTTRQVKEYPDGIFLVFTPQNQAIPSAGKIDFSFYNHTGYSVSYVISIKDGSGWSAFRAGMLGPRHIDQVETLTPQEIDEWSALKTDVIFYSEDRYAHRDPVSATVRLRGAKFFKDSSYQLHELTGKKVFVAEVALLESEVPEDEQPRLDNEAIRRMLLEKEQKQPRGKVSVPARKNQSLEREVDLHIEELLDSWQGLSNAQLLDIQLRRMQEALDEAMLDRCQRIIFIHGIGNGRLKEEIRKILSGIRGIRFHDASYQRYGFGATEVEIF